jgi:hypothetical protein
MKEEIGAGSVGLPRWARLGRFPSFFSIILYLISFITFVWVFKLIQTKSKKFVKLKVNF